MIIEIVGKEIEKIKGDFESYLNGLNMVGDISYSQYSELYDEGTKQIQKAYELGRAELEKENAELKKEVEKHKWNDIFLEDCTDYDKKIAEEYTTLQERIERLEKENAELKGIKDVATLIRANNDTVTTLMQLNNKLVSKSQQLTKAKEIIREFMKYEINEYDGSLEIHFEELKKQAEQFLNSEVEK